jgi:hypothetical protein
VNLPSQNDLSVSKRIALGMVGAAGSLIAIAIASLWVTEPARLPTLTAVAFGAIIALGASWGIYAAWALSVRLPMFGRDRVIAWSIATVASLVSTLIVVAIGFDRGWTVAVLAPLAVSSVELGVAGWLLHRNVRRHRMLVARRHVLEAELRGR